MHTVKEQIREIGQTRGIAAQQWHFVWRTGNQALKILTQTPTGNCLSDIPLKFVTEKC